MLNQIVDKIKDSKNIVIAGHLMPDGDALGSAIALYYIIKKYDSNKNVKVCFNDTLPEYMKKVNPDIKIYKEVKSDIDLLISVDTANVERLAVTEDMIKRAKNKVVIDHHISNKKYFDINYVKEISSASEMVYEFIKKLNVDLDKDIAKYIYLGIINDTGCFRHPNVTYKTMYIASKLLETGIDSNKIYQYIFSKSKNKAEILSKSVIEGNYDDKLKFMYYNIDKSEIQKNNYTRDDMEGIAEYMLNIDEVEIAVFMREEDDGSIKGSFRSKGNIDVNSIAANFNGGGHKNASGFKTNKNVEYIINKTKEILRYEKSN
ncbi:DHH family phosphoesterase [Oceanivirga salmonicida]|uniref:DHH family phosphoesterase n=1 Tax=Oceanivirga salmonicida TaxID=1769291 RepID=UPI00082FE436|nr:bifunctional oligoribonuclease/PAP phosphatase NrnA [Oceanivirga salmonicida]